MKAANTEDHERASGSILDRVIRFALAHRRPVLLAAAGLLVAVGLLLSETPIDVLPDLNRPIVSIVAEGRGRAAEEVELHITIPIESALLGAPDLVTVRSTSKNGVSLLAAEFEPGTDIYRARQIVSERLAHAQNELPVDVAPALNPTSSIMGEILLIGLYPDAAEPSKADTMLELRTWADWNLRRRLLTIAGISNVVVIGGESAEYQIEIDDRRLPGYDLTLDEVLHNLRGLGLNGSGGFITRDHEELVLRGIASIYAPEEIGATVVGRWAGFPVRIRDIARVRLGGAVRRGDAGVNGHPGVIVAVQKQPGASTLKLTQEIESTLAQLESELPPNIKMVPGLFRQAEFINRAITNVFEAIRDGTVMVVIVLFLFLWNGRATLISLTAIPISVTAAILCLRAFGLELNTMTLGGFAIAAGELVDDAIVDVENIFRRLRQLSPAEQKQPATVLRVVYGASQEVRKSIVLATLVVIVVFLPLTALGGVEGKLLLPLAAAYVTAILASLATALTVTPVLSYYLLPGAAARATRDGWLLRVLKEIQARFLKRLLGFPRFSLVILGACLAIAVALFWILPRQFMPPFNEGTIMVETQLPTGTSLDHSIAVARRVEALLKSHRAVESISRRTGRSEKDEHAEGVQHTEFEVRLRSGIPRRRVLRELREKLHAVEEIAVNFGQPISHRLDHMLTGINAEAGIFFFGPDARTLVSLAYQARGALEKLPGVVDLLVETGSPARELKIAFDFERAARLGVSVPRARQRLDELLGGTIIGAVYENKRAIPIRARLRENSRSDPTRLRALVVDRTAAGFPIRLDQIAEIYESSNSTEIKRLNGATRIALQFNIEGRDSREVLKAVQGILSKDLKLPEGYRYELGGRFREQERAFRRVGWAAVLAVLLTALIVYSGLRSRALTTQVLLSLPAALAGGLAALWLAGISLNMASLVGFIALGGIAVRNAILMISHFQNLMRREGESFSVNLILRGARERLAPVLMTASTAVLALLPIVLGGSDAPGKEILFPVALVISGGLFTSTLVDLAVTPVLFFRFTGKELRSSNDNFHPEAQS